MYIYNIIITQKDKTMTNLTVQQLEAELKSFNNKKEALIKSYEVFPSENLQDRIIDLNKTIGTITYELNYKKTFKK